MLDTTQFSYGFGLVLLPFLVGICIRFILSALDAGSTRYFVYIFVCVLVFHNSDLSAAEYTGVLSGIAQDDTMTYVSDGDNTYSTDNEIQSKILVNAFYNSRTVTIDYSDSTFAINQITISDNASIETKTYSLFIGALGCLAFVSGICLKV